MTSMTPPEAVLVPVAADIIPVPVAAVATTAFHIH